MAHVTTHSPTFSMPKPHLSARARTVAFYIAVAIIGIAVSVPVAIMTTAAPPF